MSEESAAERRRFAWLFVGVYMLLTAPRLFFHEFWRDEAWLWLVVGDSRSLADLFAPLSRSGQGYLFPVLCFAARNVSTSPRAMQVLHVVLAGAAAFVFTRWAPFARRERALFALGYFPFYEYAVISRHYVLGALLLWLACMAARSRQPALALGAVVGLLCQTTVYGYILAVAVASGWLLDRWLRRGEMAPVRQAEVIAGLTLAVIGAVAGLVQLVPQPDTSFAPAWRLNWDAAHASTVLAMPWRAFVPLPRPEIQFWNTNLLDTWPGLQATAGLLTLLLAVALLWRRPVAAATFCIGATGLLAFGYVKFAGVMRHEGHLWLLLAAALWLGGDRGVPDDRRSWRARAFLALLIIHCGAGAFASWIDLRHPFSNGATTAEMIRRQGWDRRLLFGHREPPATTVALALGRPLYSPSRRIFASYPDWGPEQRELSAQEVRCAARELSRREAQDVLLVMNWEIPPWEELAAAGSRRGAIAGSENYYLYWLHHGRLAGTAPAAQCTGETQ